MQEGNQLSRDAFIYLAQAVGLDTKSDHMNELYSYVQSMLKSIESLKNLDVNDAEPDMAFQPPQ